MKRTTLVSLLILTVSAGCSKRPDSRYARVDVTGELPDAVDHHRPSALGPVRFSHAAVAPLVIPEGAVVAIRTSSGLSTKSASPGERFSGTLSEPLVIDGRTAALRGARAEGIVVNSDPGGRVTGRAFLKIRLTALDVAGRGIVAVQSQSVTYVARGTKKRDALKIGIAGSAGAAIGAMVGGPFGAAIGAAAGASASSGYVLSTRGVAAVIPSESVVVFRLTEPVSTGRL